MKILFQLSVLVLVSLNSFSQYSSTQYSPKCEGEMPDDITISTFDKLKTARGQEDSVQLIGKTKKTKESFVLKSSYLLDEILITGNALYGDNTTSLINGVADELLGNDPETREKLTFYTLASNQTNAFSTHQGMIFVTTGLIARMENVDQLACVLAHEIAHYKKKHVINAVLEADRVHSNKERKSQISTESNITKLSKYSKQLEMEADSIGLKMVSQSIFDPKAFVSTLKMLSISHLPILQGKPNIQQFSNRYFGNEHQVTDTFSYLPPSPLYLEESKTHPSIGVRLDAIAEQLPRETTSKKSQALNAAFKDVVKTCRYEYLRIALRECDFYQALYVSGLMDKSTEMDQDYLRNIAGKCLYGISMYTMSNPSTSSGGNSTETISFDTDTDADADADAESEPIDRIELSDTISLGGYGTAKAYFQSIKTEEFVLAAIKELWEQYIEFSDSNALLRLESLVRTANGTKIFDPAVIIEQFSTTETAVADTTKRKDEKLIQLIKTLFAEISEKEIFAKFLADHAGIEQEKYKEIFTPGKNEKIEEFNGNLTPVNKILAVAPDYRKVDERRGVRLINAEKNRYKIYDQLEFVGEKSGLKVDVLSPRYSGSGTSEDYNQMARINNWTSECMTHASQLEYKMIPSEYEYITEVKNLADSPHFMYTGVAIFKHKKRGVFLKLVGSVLVPYAAPFYLYSIFKPNYNSYYFSLIMDADQHQAIAGFSYYYGFNPSQSDINSMMYEMFTKLQQKQDK